MIKRNILFIVISFLFVESLYAQLTVYVSPSGDDSNSGTIDFPYATVQKAVKSVTKGDTVYLRNGLYRETVEVSTAGINIIAYPNENPVLKGSDIMTGWETEGLYYKKYVNVQPQQVFVNGNNPLQQIGIPSEFFAPGASGAKKKYLSPVGTDINDMAPGRFWWQNDSLYIWLADSSDPNTNTIEVSQRQFIIKLANNNYVKGIQFEHSNTNTFREQGSAVSLSTGSVLDNCIIQWCDFSGVSMGDKSKVINSVAKYNGAVGISSSGGDGFLVKNTRMAYNNYRNFYSQWHTGGFKGATQAWGTIENCEVDNNNGAGVWFDYCHKALNQDDGGLYPIIIRNNYFHSNGTGSYEYDTLNNMPSITIEVSSQAYVYNNIIDKFQYRGIWVSSATDSYFVNNILTNGDTGGSYVIDGGASYVDWAWVRNNVIANNILYNNAFNVDIRMQPDDGGTKYYNNICQNNIIYNPDGGIKFKYGSRYKTSLEAWQSDTPFGDNSLNEDPMIDISSYKLKDNSPCINTGYNVIEDTMLTDYFENNRIIGSIIDMGIHEHDNGAIMDASLNSLTVDLGTINPEFNLSEYVYFDTLPDGTTSTPVVAATASNSNATVDITDAIDITSSNVDDRTTIVKVTAEDGVNVKVYSVEFYSEIDDTTAISNIAKNKVALYPNPTTGIFYINGIQQNTNVKIMDITGQIIETYTNIVNNQTIDISDNPSGIYFVEISYSQSREVYKIQVK